MLKVSKDWSIFLDRDGVINKRNFDGYITHPNEFLFEEGAEQAIAEFNKLFGHTFVVTNQQGVGKGLMTECNLLDLHDYMQEELKNHKAEIDKIYYSTDLRSKINNTRKPNPAMAFEAKKNFPKVDLEKSIMVGDTKSDIEFGKNLGMVTVLIKSKEVVDIKADYEFDNLLELSKRLKENA